MDSCRVQCPETVLIFQSRFVLFLLASLCITGKASGHGCARAPYQTRSPACAGLHSRYSPSSCFSLCLHPAQSDFTFISLHKLLEIPPLFSPLSCGSKNTETVHFHFIIPVSPAMLLTGSFVGQIIVTEFCRFYTLSKVFLIKVK